MRTPHIDRLAQRGTLFRHAYSSWSSCLPSRSSFLSGWQPTRAPIFDWSAHHSRLGPLARALYLPQHFQANGYFTARLDKVFHIGKDDARSWSRSEEPWRDPAGTFRPISTGKEIAALNFESRIRRSGSYEEVAGEKGPYAVLDATDDELFDGHTTRRATEILQERSRGAEPFFLAVGFRRPHLPWTLPARYFELYPPDRIELPPRAADAGVAPVDEHVHREMIAHYYAAITFLDNAVGRVLEALDALGLAESTVVLLYGDQGYCLGERGAHFGKGKLWERALHVPLIVAGPGLRRGATCDQPVSLLDVYPTLVDLAGLPPPATTLDGRSLRPLLTLGHDDRWRGYAVSFSPDSRSKQLAGTVRTERYRYTENAQREPVELIDCRNDPFERQNLVGHPAHATVQRELAGILASEWKPAW